MWNAALLSLLLQPACRLSCALMRCEAEREDPLYPGRGWGLQKSQWKSVDDRVMAVELLGGPSSNAEPTLVRFSPHEDEVLPDSSPTASLEGEAESSPDIFEKETTDYPSRPDSPPRKKWWQFWKEEEEPELKPIPVHKLFRFATCFDWFLITISVISAIVHGCAIPGAMYVFGDLTNLFFNHDISRQVFEGVQSNFTTLYGNFRFNESGSLSGPEVAIATLTVTPNVVATADNVTSLTVLAFNILSASSTNTTFSALSGLGCMIDTYSRQGTDGLDTNFKVLRELATNPSYTLDVTDEACSCLQTEFRAFSSEATCYSDHSFFYGLGGIDGIFWIIYLFLIISGGAFLVGSVQTAMMRLACERQVYRMRVKMYASLLRQDIGWFDCNDVGELAVVLQENIDKVHAGIGDKFAMLIQWVTTFIAGFVVGFIRGWQLALLLAFITPIMGVAGAVFFRLAASFTSQEQKLYAGAGAIAEEVLSSVRTVVAFGGEYKEVDRYKTKLADARRVGAKKGASVGASLAVFYAIIFIVYAVAFWFGGYLISVEILLAGDMLAVFYAILVGSLSLGQANPSIESLVTATGAAAEIFEVIDREPPIPSDSDEGLKPDDFKPSITFQDVVFRYPARPDVPVLTGLDLQVNVGQTVALVGPSGCGKSTVMSLIQRFYNILGGQITIGGHDIKDLNVKWLRSNIGVVSQEPVLFDTTIAENISYGKEGATREEIETAARAANAHNFISELPDGYNTLVGEKGAQLSGGQKQRIAIARALVRDPKILLLDEATSALDTESEKIVQEALDKAREGRTTIIIAHRLSTIQQTDVIIAMEKGRVVESGTHSELLELNGLYHELVNYQSAGESLGLGPVSKQAVSDTDGTSDTPSPIKRRSSLIYRRRGTSFRRAESRHEGYKGRRRFTTQATHFSDDIDVGGAPIARKQSLRLTNTRSTTVNASFVPVAVPWTPKEQEGKDEEESVPQVSLIRVMKANSKEWWIIALGLLGSIVLGVVYPVFAVIFGQILDIFARPPSEILSGLHPWAGLFLVMGAVVSTGAFLKTLCLAIAGENLTARLREWSFRTFLRQEMSWYDKEENSTGELTTSLSTDASLVQGATGSRLGTLVEISVAMFLSLAISLIYSWMLTLVLMGFIPVFIFAGFVQFRATTEGLKTSNAAMNVAGKIVISSLDNIRTVSSLGIQSKFYLSYINEISVPYKKAIAKTPVFGLAYGFSQGVLFLGYVVTFGFGAYQVTRQEGDIAYSTFSSVFVVFTAVIFGALGAGQASSFAPDYAKAKESANRIFALLDREPVVDGYSKDGLQPNDVSSKVELKRVQFNYPARPNVPVLQGLSISVEPGQTLALVGPSGCGKSTVVSLIERFYDPLGGQVYLEDITLSDLNIRWLRNQIGIVSQEPVLFDKSIADNIRYGANFREVTDEEVIEAAKAANIHNFIQALPQGYGTNVGSKGTQLSGGQKQRIAIARALVRDPKILLLDEATSALDTESEKIVQEALDKAREGRTTIIIAHRLSTIYNSNCIAVISKGVVSEKGTHNELMDRKGIYYRLNQYQLHQAKATRVGSVHPSNVALLDYK